MSRAEKGLLFATVALTVPLVAAGFWVQSSRELPKYNIPTPVMPSPNARDDYIRATKLITRQAGGMIGNQAGKFTPAQRAAVAAQDAPGLAEAKKGFAYEYRNPPVRSFTKMMPELADFRELARTYAVTAESKAERGDYAGSAEAALDCMRFGSDLPRGGTFIPLLVGLAVDAIGRAQLWKVAERLNPEDARAAIARLEELDARRVPASDAMTEEKWLSLASVVPMLASPNAMAQIAGASQTANSSGFDFARWSAQFRASFFDKRKALDDYNKYMDANIARLSEPYQPNRPKIPVPNDPLNQAICLDSFDGIQAKQLDVAMQNALLRLTLALSAYRQEKGKYPATLDELVTGQYLSVMLMDPFSPGNPPRYRPVSPTKYLLYSVGPDGKDDGGIPVTRVNNYVEVGMMGDFVVHVNSYDAKK